MKEEKNKRHKKNNTKEKNALHDLELQILRNAVDKIQETTKKEFL